MTEPPREFLSSAKAMAAWESANEQERLRALTSVAELVEADRLDPNTPDTLDVEYKDDDESSSHRSLMIGQDWNVTAMRQVRDLLRKWGWAVLESTGWESRGVGTLRAKKIGCHHTGAAVDIDRILRDGRSDLNGPLCNFALHADDTIVLMAAGTANHFGIASVSNGEAWGIEATGPIPVSAKGKSAFPNYRAYTALCVAIRIVEGWPASSILAHKEVALPDGRKPDPAFGSVYPKPYPDMDMFRAECTVSVVLKNPGLATEEDMALTPVQEARLNQAVDAILATNDQGNDRLARLDRRSLYIQVLEQYALQRLGVAIPGYQQNGEYPPPSGQTLEDALMEAIRAELEVVDPDPASSN